MLLPWLAQLQLHRLEVRKASLPLAADGRDRAGAAAARNRADAEQEQRHAEYARAAAVKPATPNTVGE